MLVQEPTPEAAARRAAGVLADLLRDAVDRKGRAAVALSGGRSAGAMVAALVEADLPWSAVHLFQVDERVVPADHPDRNWRTLALLAERLPAGNAHPMPVERADADIAYAHLLEQWCGRPPSLDAIHLGLGTDGHTASLVPGDPAQDVMDDAVTFTGEYLGHRRLTLTFPVLDRASAVVWLVTGGDKHEAVRQLVDGDGTLVAARVRSGAATLVVDLAAVRGPAGD